MLQERQTCMHKYTDLYPQIYKHTQILGDSLLHGLWR